MMACLSLIKMALSLLLFQENTYVHDTVSNLSSSAALNTAASQSVSPGVGGGFYVVLTRITMQKRKGKQGVAVA